MAKKPIRTQADFNNPSDAGIWREELASLLTVEDWHEVGATGEPAFENSWVNYGSDANGDWETAAFYKDPLGVVHLKGFIASGVVATGNGPFTLPEGYRPSKNELFAGHSDGGASHVFVLAGTGKVVIQVGTNTWQTLSGITFKAA